MKRTQRYLVAVTVLTFTTVSCSTLSKMTGGLFSSSDAPPAEPNRKIASVPHARKRSGAPGKKVVYVVKPHDTLMKISFELLGDVNRWHEIYEDNQKVLSRPGALSAGTKLTVELSEVVPVEHHGDPYLIKHGDTLMLISKWAYGTFSRWKDLWNNNRALIHNPNKIYAGLEMYYVKDQPDAPKNASVRTPASVTGAKRK